MCIVIHSYVYMYVYVCMWVCLYSSVWGVYLWKRSKSSTIEDKIEFHSHHDTCYSPMVGQAPSQSLPHLTMRRRPPLEPEIKEQEEQLFIIIKCE